MALDTYSGLTATVADWLNRADLTSQIPDFVRLFEARANRALRTHDMVKRSTALVDDEYFAVPPDWKETISLMSMTGRPDPLEFVSVEAAMELRRRYYNAPGAPLRYTHMDGKFFLLPAPAEETTLELIYRAAIPPLSASVGSTSNWLLARSPDLYLFGTLAEAEPYLKNDERVQLWQTKANGIIADMQYEAERASFPQGKLSPKFRSFG